MIVVLIDFFNSSGFFFSFRFEMNPIFKNKELKKEYENLHKNILPSLNECGNCNVFKYTYCKKFSVNCRSCLLWRCKNCTAFNKSKNILINSGSRGCAQYVINFLIDYFFVSDLSNEFFNMNISAKVREKYILFINDDSNKNNIDCNKKNDKKVQYQLNGKKCTWYFKK